MAKITKFDPAALETLRPKIVAALDTLSDLGLLFKIGRMTFGANQFSTKMTVTLSSVDIPAEDYKKYCSVYGLKAEWLRQTVTDNDGAVLTIVGLDTAKKTQPVMLLTGDGKKLFADTTFIKTNLMSPKDLLAEGKKNWNDSMKTAQWAHIRLHSSDPVYLLKPEWFGQLITGGKFTIAGLMYSDPVSVLVRDGALTGDGRFGTFTVPMVLYSMAPEVAAAHEYEVKCVQDEYSIDGLRKEWLGKDFVLAGKTFKLIGLDMKHKKIIMESGDSGLRVAPIKDIVEAMQKQHPLAAKGAAAAKGHKIDRVA